MIILTVRLEWKVTISSEPLMNEMILGFNDLDDQNNILSHIFVYYVKFNSD